MLRFRWSRGISSQLVTLLLMGVTLTGGVIVYGFFSGFILAQMSRVEVTVESMSLVRDSDGTIVFSITVKNTGGKSVSKCEVTVSGDQGNATLSLGAMEPGQTASGYLIIGGELVENPNVESGSGSYPDNWGVWPPGSPNAEWTTEDSYSPTHSLEINCTSQASVSWYSNVFHVTAGRTYRFRAVIKGSYTSGVWILSILWYQNPDKTGYLGYSPVYLASSYSSWTLVEGVAVAPSGAKYATLEFWTQNGVGLMRADDFSVRETYITMTPGKTYTVVVEAEATDGSRYVKTTTVTCTT